MKTIRITYEPGALIKLDPISGVLEIRCQSHQSPMLPACVTLLDNGQFKEQRYIRVNHRGGMKLGQKQS